MGRLENNITMREDLPEKGWMDDQDGIGKPIKAK